MPADIISITGAGRLNAFRRCADVLRSGGIVAYPTDTLYGLGADPTNRNAVRKLFSLKGRSEDQPILLLISSAAEVAAWASEISDAARRLMERFWPGPLTIILPAQADVPPELTAGTGTIGLRVPGSETTRSLLEHVGFALTGTSANKSGRDDPRTVDDVLSMVGNDIDLILDGGPVSNVLPSTVVDAGGGTLRIVREGAVPRDLVLKALTV